MPIFTTASIWSRAKNRWSTVRYEYPEAHRPPPRGGSRDTNAAGSTGVLDPEELLPLSIRDHPLHRTTLDRLQIQLYDAAQYCAWTVLHGVVMYVFWVHVRPRVTGYFRNWTRIDNDDDDDDTKPTWTQKWRSRMGFSQHQQRRLCCCCDSMVSWKDNFCPKCGSPTCPVCVYCGAGMQNEDNFCPACGRPVPNQVIVDGRPPPSAPSSRFSSTSTGTNSPLTPRSPLQYQTNSFESEYSQQQARMPRPYAEVRLPPALRPVKQEFTQATAESMPLGQADDGFVPLVPAMYVEEVIATMEPPPVLAAISTVEPIQFAIRPPDPDIPQLPPRVRPGAVQQEETIDPRQNRHEDLQQHLAHGHDHDHLESELMDAEESKDSRKQQ